MVDKVEIGALVTAWFFALGIYIILQDLFKAIESFFLFLGFILFLDVLVTTISYFVKERR